MGSRLVKSGESNGLFDALGDCEGIGDIATNVPKWLDARVCPVGGFSVADCAGEAKAGVCCAGFAGDNKLVTDEELPEAESTTLMDGMKVADLNISCAKLRTEVKRMGSASTN